MEQTFFKAFIADEGSYNQYAGILVFDVDDLTEKQWAIVADLPDSLKFEYAQAIFNGDDEFVTEIESEYE